VRVAVTDPDGLALEAASVTLTISIPGIPVITTQGQTDATGAYTFSTTIPPEATPGSGPASALVTTLDFGETTARTVITIVE
jgi:hypothetical protein